MNLRILLSAFACDPYFGSDEEVGWQWVRELSSRGHDVTVLTRASHQASIEKCIQETGDCKNVHFVYHDLPTLHSLLRRINRRNQIYYYFWQWSLRKVVKLILREKKFDVIHHITWVSFRQPSFLGGMGVPFYFGPVSGGDEFPLRYSIAFSTKEQFIESARVFLNRLVRWDPFMRRTFQQADKIFLTSRCHLALVPPAAAKKASIELAIASPPTRKAVTRSKQFDPTRPRFLFVGRCIAWKGMDIGLLALHRILQSTPEATLTVIGDGHERARWEDQANKLGIENSILWKGWIPRSEVLDIYSDYDILFNPSLRDSGGFVVLEALQNGVPVVCFNLGGPGQVVESSCGVSVDAPPTASAAAEAFAKAALELSQRLAHESRMPDSCRARAMNFTWDALVSRIYQHIIADQHSNEPASPH